MLKAKGVNPGVFAGLMSGILKDIVMFIDLIGVGAVNGIQTLNPIVEINAIALITK